MIETWKDIPGYGGNMNDLISRRDLYERIAELEADVRKKLLSTPRDSEAYIRYVERLNERSFFKHEIMDAPKVEAVPVVHGEWIKINNRPKTYIRRCSVCGRDSYTCFSEKDYDYCPWCRADMRKKV